MLGKMRTAPDSIISGLGRPEAPATVADGGHGVTRASGSRRRRAWLCALAASVLALASCQDALRSDADAELQRSLDATLAREASSASLSGGPRETRADRSLDPLLADLASRREQLDALGPQASDAGIGLDVGPDLDGAPPREVVLTLQQAIASTVQNNLGVQQARLEEAMSQADIVRAEAVFDAVLFSNGGYRRSNIPQPTLEIGGPGGAGTIPLNPTADQSIWNLQAGVEQKFATGASLLVSTKMQGQEFVDAGDAVSPNPSYLNSVNLTLSQPLLRNFGTDVNLASLRIARNQDRRALQGVRQALLAAVVRTESLYWQVYVARQRLVSSRWLLEAGERVRTLLERRRAYDTSLAQYADAVSKVEDRRAGVIRAERDLQRAVNELKRSMNDPRLPVGGAETVVTVDSPVDQALRYSTADAFATALAQNPLVASALLSIDDSSIGVDVADNGRLPQLDLQASGALYGLAAGFGDSWQQLGDDDYIEWAVGATFRQPIGNRAAEADFRKARLARSRAVILYKSAVQSAVLDVRNALQDAAAAFRLIGQTRAQRLAAAENMRALDIDEENIPQLTPEFLALKFFRQDGLAIAQVAEAVALADYNVAIASLHAAMGTALERNRIELKVVDAQPSS
jgi:outer membrane protein TolC